MSTAPASWNVLEHGPIERLENNLWRVEGALPHGPLRRVMTVVRLSDGRLVIHNAIAMGEPEMAELEAFGRPAVLLVPNAHHRLDAPAFKARYPDLRVLCPRGARGAVAKAIAVDGDYDDPTVRSDELQLLHLSGTGEAEGVVCVRSGSGSTLIFNDAIFNMPHVSGVAGFVLKHLANSSGGPRISRVARLVFIKDAAALRVHLQQLADTPGLVRVIVSHHQVIDQDPAGVLRLVSATL